MEEEENYVWAWNQYFGQITTHHAYYAVSESYVQKKSSWWHIKTRNWSIASKLKCFIWLALRNQIYMGEKMTWKGIYGPNIGLLCLNCSEFVVHLFFKCAYSKSLSLYVLGAINLKAINLIEPLDHCLLWWEKNMGTFKTILVLIAWGIWKDKNTIIFVVIPKETNGIQGDIVGFFSDYIKPKRHTKIKYFSFPPSSYYPTTGFFDGASQARVCGGGAIIFLPRSMSIYIWLNIDTCSNTKVELTVAWALLFFVASSNISSMHIHI